MIMILGYDMHCGVERRGDVDIDLAHSRALHGIALGKIRLVHEVHPGGTPRHCGR
jgi:hypothetical protein